MVKPPVMTVTLSPRPTVPLPIPEITVPIQSAHLTPLPELTDAASVYKPAVRMGTSKQIKVAQTVIILNSELLYKTNLAMIGMPMFANITVLKILTVVINVNKNTSLLKLNALIALHSHNGDIHPAIEDWNYGFAPIPAVEWQIGVGLGAAILVDARMMTELILVVAVYFKHLAKVIHLVI